MATWGYRVYTFELLAGQESLAQEVEAHRERLLEVLNQVGQMTRVGKPHNGLETTEEPEDEALEDLQEDDYEETQPTLTIRGSAYAQDLSVIHSNIALGEQGLHDYAINPHEGTDRVDVKSRSAETPRRTDFYFASAGFEGFLVTEVVGMKDPVPMLARWIRSVSLAHRQRDLAAITKEYKTPDHTGNRITKTEARAKVPKTLRIKVDRVADPDLLQRILDDIQSMDTEYTEIDENNNETDKRLIVKVREKNAQRSIANLIAGASDGEVIIRQTLGELDIDPDELSAANISPKKVKARVRSSNGATTLVPGKASDLFNYPFKEKGRPGNYPFYATTLGKINRLKDTAEIALATPETSEIVDWVGREEETWQQVETHRDE